MLWKLKRLFAHLCKTCQEETRTCMTLRGVGTDIIEIQRMRAAVERHGQKFLQRLFTEKELAYCRRYRDAIPHLAGRFAAKEAVAKALGSGIGKERGWKEIEILNNGQGKPEVLLRVKDASFRSASILLSISHCENYATATAIIH